MCSMYALRPRSAIDALWQLAHHRTGQLVCMRMHEQNVRTYGRTYIHTYVPISAYPSQPQLFFFSSSSSSVLSFWERKRRQSVSGYVYKKLRRRASPRWHPDALPSHPHALAREKPPTGPSDHTRAPAGFDWWLLEPLELGALCEPADPQTGNSKGSERGGKGEETQSRRAIPRSSLRPLFFSLSLFRKGVRERAGSGLGERRSCESVTRPPCHHPIPSIRSHASIPSQAIPRAAVPGRT